MTAIFDKLICSECKKYLSVFPIKVYPNKLVKCGRCSSNDDNGMVSELYEKIAKELRFPCINLYEGCRKFLESEEVVLHEKSCVGTWVTCPICNFQGNSLAILEHFKQEHPDNYLNLPVFSIPCNDKNEEEFYLYASDLEHTIAVVNVRYDHIVNTLHFDIIPIYMEAQDHRNFIKKFELYTVNHSMIYKSTEKKCERYVGCSATNNGFNEILIKEKYPSHVAICKFSVKDDYNRQIQPKTIRKEVVKENIEGLYFPGSVLCLIKNCGIENNGIHRIRFYIRLVGLTEVYSSDFCIADSYWKIRIGRNNKEITPYLSLSVVKDESIYEIHLKKKNKDDNKFSYKVSAEMELSSDDVNKNWLKSFEGITFGNRKHERMEIGWDHFILWTDLEDPSNSYVNRNEHEQGFIEVEFRFNVIAIIKHLQE